jgi:hypothetical protein
MEKAGHSLIIDWLWQYGPWLLKFSHFLEFYSPILKMLDYSVLTSEKESCFENFGMHWEVRKIQGNFRKIFDRACSQIIA